MMLRRWILIATVLVAFGGSYALKRQHSGRSEADPRPPGGPARIVSLAPSITEILFELGLGDRVVGVTRYCGFPPEAKTKPQMGGYYDPNYEPLKAARPDLVITVPEHDDVREELRKLGVKTMTVDHTSIRGIMESIVAIGTMAGCPERAAALRARLETRIRKIGERNSGKPRVRVLISVGRMAGDGSASRITVCGRSDYFQELLGLAGGVNAYEGDIPYPAMSAEGVLKTNPDVIIDLWPDLKEKNIDPESVRRQWTSIPGLKARVHVIGEDYVMIPGLRIVLLLEDFAAAMHPEAPRD